MNKVKHVLVLASICVLAIQGQEVRTKSTIASAIEKSAKVTLGAPAKDQVPLAATPAPSPQPPVQPTNVVYATAVDYDFYLLNQFLNGMRATVFAPNVMRCSAKL